MEVMNVRTVSTKSTYLSSGATGIGRRNRLALAKPLLRHDYPCIVWHANVTGRVNAREKDSVRAEGLSKR